VRACGLRRSTLRRGRRARTPRSCTHAEDREGRARGRSAHRGALFEIIKAHFAPLSARQGLALSLYLDEVDETGSWKHNTLHERLKRT
jgi:5-carboxymethyl-2-hydroxymuconate isomerase